MMKKFIYLIVFICIAGIGIYFYAYKGHRDIATETADYTVEIATLQQEFIANDSLANSKYLDKTIETSGKITKIEVESKGIVVDEKLFATFKENLPTDLRIGKDVKIKGRFLGYDDLLEEFKIDQIIIIE